MPDGVKGVRRYRQPKRAGKGLAVAAGLTVLLVAAGVALGVTLTRDGASRQLAPTVSLVGDSLNVGIEPYLSRQLRGWRVQTDDVSGRATAEGVEAMRAAGGRLGAHVLVSLGTNDGFTPVESFRASVRQALAQAGPDRCVVWFTVFREGASSATLNGVLRQEAERADNLHLIDWEALVRAHPDWLVEDGIHATPAGYAGRARAAADALRRC